MKILFVTSLYPKEWENSLQKESKVPLQKASNLFQVSMLDGLCRSGIDFEVFCFPSLPVFPVRYKKMFSPKTEIIIDGKYIGQMISYCTLMIYKMVSIRKLLQKTLLLWLEKNYNQTERIVILTYTPYVAYLKACKNIKRKYPNIIITSVVTDLVDNMLTFRANRKFLKRIQCAIECRQTKALYQYIDKFILLSKLMEEKIPEAIGKNIVMEGIYVPNEQILDMESDSDIYSVLYSGSMHDFAGVRQLVKAFMKTDNPKFRLWLCGSGELVSYIKQQAEMDNRIKYYGVLSYNEVVRLQSIATCLINPRMPNGDITKYSFPSKTMEYMASGTPMIGYHLEGIPKEYYQYMYTPKDLSIEALQETLETVLTMSTREKETFGLNAKRFILENKTAEKQIKRIIEFIK